MLDGWGTYRVRSEYVVGYACNRFCFRATSRRVSEYQYYEFVSIDRPLTDREQRALRAISTRAEISATRFRNEYQWGDLKADPTQLLARYFDAHVYVTNWGVHRFVLRFPKELVDLKAWRPYCVRPCLTLREHGAFVLLDFEVQEEPEFDPEADGCMPALLPIRQQLLRGDLRALYLGWLSSVQTGEGIQTRREPPIPPGLKDLSSALGALREFLFLDQDLVSAAAGESASGAPPLPEGLPEFIAELAVSEKDRLLLDVVKGTEANPAAQLLRLFRNSPAGKKGRAVSADGGRSAAALLEQAAALRAARLLREEAARRQAEEAAEKARTAARARHLDALEGKEAALWAKAGTLIELKKPKAYAEAIAILRDLHDLAARDGTKPAFREKLAALLALHQNKHAFSSRVKEADLLL